MDLQTDHETQAQLARIIGRLRTARLEAGLSQPEVACGMPFRGKAISEWETGVVEPTLNHLILLAHELDHRLVVIDHDGEVIANKLRQQPGEGFEVFERRRLATPLRNRRVALGMAQGELGELVGVSGDSIQRWETVRFPPRPIAHVVWAHKIGYTLDVQPLPEPRRGPSQRRVISRFDERKNRQAPFMRW